MVTVLLVASLVVCRDVGSADRTRTLPVVVNVERGSFHWSDAAIGLLAGAGLLLAAFGCLSLARLRGAEKRTDTRGERR